jgi:hypothetical protein
MARFPDHEFNESRIAGIILDEEHVRKLRRSLLDLRPGTGQGRDFA